MPKRFGAEQIATLLRQIEVSMAQGKSAPEACWLQITTLNYAFWFCLLLAVIYLAKVTAGM